MANKSFALIGVNSDKDLEALKPVLEKEEITWRSFWNGEEGTSGPISTKWNVNSWPTVYVLDGEGKIRYKNKRGHELDKAVDALMAEMNEGKESAEGEGKAL